MPYIGSVPRVRIITLVEQRMTQREVARLVGGGQGVVSKTRFLELGTLNNEKSKNSRIQLFRGRERQALLQFDL